MKEVGRDSMESIAELKGTLQHLEAALDAIDRLDLAVIGAQLSQIIEEVKSQIKV